MKIAVMGAGAIGGYFGGRLAKAGFDVSFIARGAHLDVIRKNGLKVLSPLGDFTIHPATVTDDPAEIGPVDVILFMVKNYDTLQAAEQIRPLVGPDTAIIPFQNGVEARAMLSNVLGARHVLGGVAFIPASIQEPGVIKHNAELAKLVFGEFDKQITPRAVAFLDALEKAGVTGEIPADISMVLWSKLMFLTSMSAINCITRQPVGLVQSDGKPLPCIWMRCARLPLLPLHTVLPWVRKQLPTTWPWRSPFHPTTRLPCFMTWKPADAWKLTISVVL